MTTTRLCAECGAPLPADPENLPDSDCPVCALLGTPAPALSSAEPGDQIGPFKLIQQIGEGGCGVVYLAEQKEPIKRRVALKVIKLGMDTRQVIARFETERQVLAMMDHPNIAMVLDAGATEKGRPYFVMELVRGVKLLDYCDQQNLTIKERLDLFVRVCHAIQHAHQKGIIHRDIKPSNVLVTVHDGMAVPKVIDFGIAKATQERESDATALTQLHQFVGTPAYMSPEQAGLHRLDVDARSDIYSLGVLLYELLTGQPPFDANEFQQSALDEILRIIREQEPPRPSVRLLKLTEPERTIVAQRRRMEGAKLPVLLRGDLDWIVMKALEKDRECRYESASALADDIQRHLRHEPVVAVAPSTLYRVRKFASRHRFGLAMATTIAVVILVGAIVGIGQAVRATREASRAGLAESMAKKRLTESEAIKNLLIEVFQSPDPERDGRTITVAETLDRATKNLETHLSSQPERRAQLQGALALTYHALGLPGEAIPLEEKARDYFSSVYGAQHPDRLAAINNLARSYAAAGRHSEALNLNQEVLKISRKVFGLEHPRTLVSMENLGISYYETGRREEALKLREEVLQISRKVFSLEHSNILSAINNLAVSYDAAGRRRDALKLNEEVLEVSRKVCGQDHPDTLMAMLNLASSYAAIGLPDEALKLREALLPLSPKVFGLEHSRTLSAMNNLAVSYDAMGRREEALTLREQVVPLCRKVLGPKHPDTLDAIFNLANSYAHTSRQDEALKLREEVLKLRRDIRGPMHPDTLSAMFNLANSYANTGRRAEALKLREEVLESSRKALGPEHPDTLAAMYNLAYSYSDVGRRDEAIKLREDVLPLRRKVLGSEHPDTVAAIFDLGTSLYNAGRRGEALRLREDALTLSRKVFGAEHPKTLLAMNNLAASYSDAGREDEALKLKGEAAKVTLSAKAVESRLTSDSQKYNLADSFYRQGRYAEAEPLYREVLQNQLRLISATNETTLGVVASLARNLSDWAWVERGSTNMANAYSHAVEAERLLHECFEVRQLGTNRNHWRTVEVKSRFGFARLVLALTDGELTSEGRAIRLAEAETLLLESAAALQLEVSVSAAYKRDSLERLGRLYDVWPKPEKRAKWKLRLEAFDQAEANGKSNKPNVKARNK